MGPRDGLARGGVRRLRAPNLKSPASRAWKQTIETPCARRGAPRRSGRRGAGHRHAEAVRVRRPADLARRLRRGRRSTGRPEIADGFIASIPPWERGGGWEQYAAQVRRRCSGRSRSAPTSTCSCGTGPEDPFELVRDTRWYIDWKYGDAAEPHGHAGRATPGRRASPPAQAEEASDNPWGGSAPLRGGSVVGRPEEVLDSLRALGRSHPRPGRPPRSRGPTTRACRGAAGPPGGAARRDRPRAQAGLAVTRIAGRARGVIIGP